MSARTLTTMALASAALAAGAVTASATTTATCVVPDASGQQRISITLRNFPERSTDVEWRASAPGWATAGVQRVMDGTSTFILAVPTGTRLVDVSTKWGPDPVRDVYRTSVDALCAPLVPPTAPEPPVTTTPVPPVVTPPAPKPPATPRRWTCKTLPRGAGRAWLVRLKCIRVIPPKPKTCPTRYRIGVVVITRRTAAGIVIVRRVAVCTPPPEPAPNPTG